VLGALFFELKKYGINLDVSLTVDEAACTIANEALLSKEKKSGVG
jgi:hypothetical protein